MNTLQDDIARHLAAKQPPEGYVIDAAIWREQYRINLALIEQLEAIERRIKALEEKERV